MAVTDGEPLELCEECGSPLDEGSCRSCGPGFTGGASPVGAAPLDRRELSRVLGRSVGARAHGSYALSIQQEGRMGAHIAFRRAGERNHRGTLELYPDLDALRKAIEKASQPQSEWAKRARTLLLQGSQ